MERTLNEKEIILLREFKEQLKYWKKYLDGDINRCAMPYNNIKNCKQMEINSVDQYLPNEITKELLKISNNKDLNLMILLSSILKLLLYKYTSENTNYVIVPLLKRENLQVYNDNVIIKSVLDDNMSLKDIIINEKQVFSDAYTNGDYPLKFIIEELGISKEKVSSIFNIGFIFENVQDIDYMKDYEFELLFIFKRDNNGINLKINYNNYYNFKFINDILQTYILLAQNLITDSNTKIKRVEIVGLDERDKLLNLFNDTEKKYPSNKTIQSLFQEQVEKTPNNIAVAFNGKELTYKELNEKANSLARVLIEKGVVAEDIIGIMVERSIKMIIGIIAILKAGGAYLPIDPQYPKDRIKYMLKDSNTEILLTQKKLLEKIKYDGEVIDIEDNTLYKKENSNLNSLSSENNLAYIIYTSGTTGNPKGVMIEHRSVVGTLLWRREEYGLNDKDNVLILASYAFDSFVTSFFTNCISGANSVIIEDNKDIFAIKRCIVENKITHFTCVPALYLGILECSEYEDLKTLRIATLAGDSTTKKIISLSKEKNIKIELINEYGPTENSVVTTLYRHMEKIDDDVIPIGKPRTGTNVYILDKNNCLRPIGIEGELCVSGDSLARGYLNRKDLTEEKFVKNPFIAGTKMYKTGDLARWMPDGNIEYLGRIDNQVKIRGYRIEIEEIQADLFKVEEIKDAVVVIKSDTTGEKYICAYVVADKEISVILLKEQISKELPTYMIPRYIIQLEKLPLTPNGKIDRNALPEPNIEQIARQNYEAPRNKVEDELSNIWSEVLGIEKIGINDNFFELGGHSLKAALTTSKIKEKLKVYVKVVMLFENPTIKTLGKLIESLDKEEYFKIKKAEVKKFYKASSTEKRLFALWELDRESIVYNVPTILEIEEEIDVRRIENVLNMLVSRHEILRTSFQVVNGEVMQKVSNKCNLDFEYNEVDSTKIDGIINSFTKPFDLTKAPLIRSKLIKYGEKQYIFMIDFPHIVVDGVSIGILIKEFTELYKGNKLQEMILQYKDYSEWQNSIIGKEIINKEEEYWLNRFAGEIPLLNIQICYERPKLKSFEGSQICFTISKELTEKLMNIAKEINTTLYTVLLTSYNILLYKYTGQEDIIIGTAEAGRNRVELNDVVGMFINTIALRNYPKGSKTFREFLYEVKNNTLNDFENSDYKFDDLLEKLNIKRVAGRNPLFDAMFVLENMDIGFDKINKKIKSINSECTISKFDFTLAAVEVEDGMNFGFEYCTKIINKDTAEKMCKHYINILQELSENMNIKLNEIKMLSDEEFKEYEKYTYNEEIHINDFDI